MPAGGLRRSMLRSEVALDPCDIYLAAGNRDDEILHGCQRYWIAEAIRYTHREAVEELFTSKNCVTVGWRQKTAPQRQAECICLALANFNAIAYDVYANEQESTMVGLKDYSQYQKFVELLNYYYCGAKHFLTKLESSGAGEVEQDQLDRLRKEHEDLNIHIDS